MRHSSYGFPLAGIGLIGLFAGLLLNGVSFATASYAVLLALGLLGAATILLSRSRPPRRPGTDASQDAKLVASSYYSEETTSASAIHIPRDPKAYTRAMSPRR
ncbi:MAG: hypothetical protein AAFY03_11730 [Pseudomonadota bacterium]